MYGNNNFGIPATGYGSTSYLQPGGLQQQTTNLPSYQGKIPTVHGEAGVEAFRMGTNSSVFLADETEDNIVWIKSTDSGGYVTKTKFKLVPAEDSKPEKIETKDYVTKQEFEDLKGKVDKVLKELS